MAPLFSIYINVVIRKASYIISDRANLRKIKVVILDQGMLFFYYICPRHVYHIKPKTYENNSFTICNIDDIGFDGKRRWSTGPGVACFGYTRQRLHKRVRHQ